MVSVLSRGKFPPKKHLTATERSLIQKSAGDFNSAGVRLFFHPTTVFFFRWSAAHPLL
jgi:hypothetical protein